MVIAIVGASADRNKYGNKALRAYVKQGFTVYPVNNQQKAIEGLTAVSSVLDIPVAIDRVSVYLHPEDVLEVLDEIAEKGTKELFLNPGSESDAVLEKARSLGLEPMVACSIVAIGETPGRF